MKNIVFFWGGGEGWDGGEGKKTTFECSSCTTVLNFNTVHSPLIVLVAFFFIKSSEASLIS